MLTKEEFEKRVVALCEIDNGQVAAVPQEDVIAYASAIYDEERAKWLHDRDAYQELTRKNSVSLGKDYRRIAHLRSVLQSTAIKLNKVGIVNLAKLFFDELEADRKAAGE